jgi:hypothetical protein
VAAFREPVHVSHTTVATPPVTEPTHHPPSAAPPRSPQRRFATLATIASLIVVSLLVLSTSRAAFTHQTDNPGNAWRSGAVALSDDKAGIAMFDVGPMVPGDVVQDEIVVTNESTVDSVDVTLFSQDLSDPDGFGEVLNLTVESDGVEIYDGTIAAFAAVHVDGDSSADDTWTGVEPEDTRTYTFTVEFDPSADETIANAEARLSFVWEAVSQPTRTLEP